MVKNQIKAFWHQFCRKSGSSKSKNSKMAQNGNKNLILETWN